MYCYAQAKSIKEVLSKKPVDKNPRLPKAMDELKAETELPESVELRQNKDTNNSLRVVMEQRLQELEWDFSRLAREYGRLKEQGADVDPNRYRKGGSQDCSRPTESSARECFGVPNCAGN